MPLKVTGMGNLYNDLQNLIESVGPEMVQKALEASAEVVAERAKQIAPVGKTGNLKDAIGVGRIRNTSRGKAITVGVHRKDFKGKKYYPAYVEYGHGGPHPAEAKPFIRPAFDATKDEAFAILRDTIISESTKG